MRTKFEALTDRLLLLYAVDRGNSFGWMDGPFKLMKIPLMAELESVSQGVNTFNYTFYRYDHGPMTTEIYEDATRLRIAGLLNVPEKGRGAISLTEAGKNLLHETSDLWRDNARVAAFVDHSAKAYAPLDFGALKAVVYGQSVLVDGEEMKIADVPYFRDVITKISGEGVATFRMSDNWIDTLWGDLNYTQEEKTKLEIIRPARVYA